MINSEQAILSYQFSEGIKSGLIIATKLLEQINGLKNGELVGAEKIMFAYINALQGEIRIAQNAVKLQGLEEARMNVDKATEKIRSHEYSEATRCVSKAISAITTIGQKAAETLKGRGLL